MGEFDLHIDPDWFSGVPGPDTEHNQRDFPSQAWKPRGNQVQDAASYTRTCDKPSSVAGEPRNPGKFDTPGFAKLPTELFWVRSKGL